MTRYHYEPHINLYTKDLSPRKLSENFYFNMMMLGTGLLLSIFITVFVVVSVRYQLARHRNRELASELTLLHAQDRELMQLSAQVSRLSSDNKALQNSIQTISTLFDRKTSWTTLIEHIASLMNDKVWLDNITTKAFPGGPQKSISVTLDGGAVSLESFNQFIRHLEDTYGNIKISVKASESNNVRYYAYSLTLFWTEKK